MRLYGFVISLLVAGVLGKNTFDFEKFKNSVENVKRDAKNVYSLDSLQELVKDEQFTKRDAKYTVDLDALVAHLVEEQSVKRDAKLVVDLSEFYNHEQKNGKRDAKNIVSLVDLAAQLEKEQTKRDAKLTLDLDDLFFKLGHNEKRDAKNVFQLSEIKLPNSKRDQHVLQNEASGSLLQSLLPQIPRVSVFAGYIRDNEKIAKKTETSGESMLIICPTDDSIDTKLSGYKPWEFPKALTGGKNDEEIATSNINYFLASHIVDEYKSELTTNADEVVLTSTLLSGIELKIKQDAQGIVSVNSGEKWIVVDDIKTVDNGYVFIINDTLIKP